MKRYNSFLLSVTLAVLVIAGVLCGASVTKADSISDAQAVIKSLNLASPQISALTIFLNLNSTQVTALNTASGIFVAGNVNPPIIPTGVVSTEVYNLNVDYSHFVSEEAQYHYTSVYSSTGTKSVAITVFKFNDKATMTADQVKTKLASLGYRPATLDETYALAQAGKWNIIGLGTSMGSYNMYPYTRNGAGNGLYSISTTASYSTQTYRFA
ncbi:MAG: hypothetical protein NTZ38_01975, partial [Candidatus Taylorbacteria bacterium]|nr:hypothetical protein [Candidatus Taylorbacteria bacterium]